MHFGDKQTDKQTDERTDGQSRCVKALSLSRAANNNSNNYTVLTDLVHRRTIYLALYKSTHYYYYYYYFLPSVSMIPRDLKKKLGY